MDDFAAGCVGGVAGVLVGHPFDTLKVRLQTQNALRPMYRSTMDCFLKIVAKETPMGLYKGVGSPLYGLTFINAIVFGVQGNMQRRFHNPDTLLSHGLAGAMAGFIQCAICGPMELAKTRMQMQGMNERKKTSKTPRMYKGSIDCIRKIYNIEGARGVSKGMLFTVCREVPSFFTYFVVFESLHRQLPVYENGHRKMSHLLVAGGLTGCASWLVTYPIDVIKSRIQADGVFRDGKMVYKYANYGDCIRTSVKEEGYRVFFRGVNSTMIRAFPTNAATFTAVMYTMRFLKGADSQDYDSMEILERSALIDVV